MLITVDVATKIIEEEHRVFVMRPGRQYRLFDDMANQNQVALDLPGLNLDKKIEIDQQRRLGEKIARSRAIQNWYLRKKSEPGRPSDNLDDYIGRAAENDTPQLGRIVRGFYKDIRRGDLIVLPPASLTSEVLLGEFTEDPGVYQNLILPSRYGQDALPSRRVKWLARMPKSKMPANILEQLRKPIVLVQVSNDQKSIFYERTYRTFSIAEKQFTVLFDARSSEFRSKNDLLLQAFFGFVSYNTMAIDLGLKPLPVLEAAFSDSQTYDPVLKININSPGNFSLSSLTITPLMSAVLLALCSRFQAKDLLQAAKDGKIKFGNSEGSEDDDCVIKVERQVIDQLKLLDLDEWADACRKARKAIEETNLEIPIRTKEEQ